MSDIPCSDFVEEKVRDIIYLNRNIINHSVYYNEEDEIMNITLNYRDFTVLMKYGDSLFEGFSFIENDDSDKTLLTKFIFPFSKIPYSIYDVHNAVNDDVFITYDFHCLYDEDAIGRAFDTVIDFVNRNEKTISAINSDALLKEKLENSFNRGLKIASKKITRDKINENPKKYLQNHDIDLYFLRLGEEAFTDFITNNDIRGIRKFYSKKMKKDALLPYEQRFYDHLTENNFIMQNAAFVREVKAQKKEAKKDERKYTLVFLCGFVITLALQIGLGIYSENRLEENYFLLRELSLDVNIAFIISVIGLILASVFPVEYFSSLKNKSTKKELSKKDKKIYSVLTVIGIAVFVLATTYSYFDCQKTVGLGENDIYYCQKIGRAQMLSYDEVRLYLIEGQYYGDEYSDNDEDKQIIVVKGDDYENYFISDYLTEVDMPNSYRDSLDYDGKFTSPEDFCNAFGV